MVFLVVAALIVSLRAIRDDCIERNWCNSVESHSLSLSHSTKWCVASLALTECSGYESDWFALQCLHEWKNMGWAVRRWKVGEWNYDLKHTSAMRCFLIRERVRWSCRWQNKTNTILVRTLYRWGDDCVWKTMRWSISCCTLYGQASDQKNRSALWYSCVWGMLQRLLLWLTLHEWVSGKEDCFVMRSVCSWRCIEGFIGCHALAE